MAELSPLMKAAGDGMVTAVKAYVARVLAPIATRLGTVETRTGALSMMLGRGEATATEKISAFEALDVRIKALEDRLPLAYGGTWSEGQQSSKGLFFTDKGSIWYCRETTRDRPGTSAAFTLACKRGSDR